MKVWTVYCYLGLWKSGPCLLGVHIRIYNHVVKRLRLKNNHSVSGLGPNWLYFCTYIYKVDYLWHLSQLSDLPVHPGLSSWMDSMQHGPSSNITGPWLHAIPYIMHPALRWSKWLVLWQVTLLRAANPNSRATHHMWCRALYYKASNEGCPFQWGNSLSRQAVLSIRTEASTMGPITWVLCTGYCHVFISLSYNSLADETCNNVAGFRFWSKYSLKKVMIV